MMIKKYFKDNTTSEKAFALPLVVIVSMLLLCLGALLLSASYDTYKSNRLTEYVDYNYIAAHNSIETFINNINMTTKQGIDFRFDFSDLKTEANKEKIVKQIYKSIKELIGAGKVSEEESNHLIEANNPGTKSLNRLYSSVTMGSIIVAADITDLLKFLDPDKGVISVPIGIKVDSSVYDQDGFALSSVSNRSVYAEKKIDFPVFMPLKLKNTAVFTMGDFLVVNSTVDIGGSINVNGTLPNAPHVPQMTRYGGIILNKNANVTVSGNAITRELIRTGSFDINGDPQPDSSTMTVGKDAIALGIYLFGKQGKVNVGKNAYTYDDLEINGPLCNLTVNGSYFGLSKGTVWHDDSSAIVNSAMTHTIPDTDDITNSDSYKSNITVWGDCMINGSLFKITDEVTGEGVPIENTGPVYNDEGIALYKMPGMLTPPSDYIKKLKASSASKVSNINIPNPRYFNNLITSNGNLIEPPALIYPALIPLWPMLSAGTADVFDILDLEFKKYDGILIPNGSINNTNILDKYIYKVSEVTNYPFYIKNFMGMETQATGTDVYNDFISIKQNLLDRTHAFVTTDISSSIPYKFEITAKSENRSRTIPSIINNLRQDIILNSLQLSSIRDISSSTLTSYENAYIYSDKIDYDNRIYYYARNGSGDITLDSTMGNPNSFYLIINENPNRKINISGNIHAYIITRGKVVINSNAHITGMIMAGGKNDSGAFDEIFTSGIDNGNVNAPIYKKGQSLPSDEEGAGLLDTNSDTNNYASVIINGANNVKIDFSDASSGGVPFAAFSNVAGGALKSVFVLDRWINK